MQPVMIWRYVAGNLISDHARLHTGSISFVCLSDTKSQHWLPQLDLIVRQLLRNRCSLAIREARKKYEERDGRWTLEQYCGGPAAINDDDHDDDEVCWLNVFGAERNTQIYDRCRVCRLGRSAGDTHTEASILAIHQLMKTTQHSIEPAAKHQAFHGGYTSAARARSAWIMILMQWRDQSAFAACSVGVSRLRDVAATLSAASRHD